MSMCFFTLVASELLVSYPSRTEVYIGFKKKLFENQFLNISMGLSLLVLVAITYIPLLNDLFTMTPLTMAQLGACLALVLIPIIGSELSKKLFVISK